MEDPSDRVMPLPALVGQERVTRALSLLAVDPRLGGVLLRGEKGTAKSTAARGLARVLPPVTDGGEERPAPFETLPLGVTEDQLLGTVDLEHALREGKKRFEPGLLARVHGGVLYVDEVNLLDDHIVDLLLDVAATGVNVVAREGVTASHPAELVLVGTMNPEEGDLRPQLLDRFGLCVDLAGVQDVETRAEVVTRVLAFEADREGFRRAWEDEERALRERIVRARELRPEVQVSPEVPRIAARMSLALGVQGHRADILLVRAAAAAAALEGRTEIEPADLDAASALVYPHRLRRRPFDDEAASADAIDAALRDAVEEEVEPEGKARAG